MGLRALRVINDVGHGFGSYSHRDMEILSYVLEERWRTRTQRIEVRAGALPADLAPAQRKGDRSQLRSEDVPGRGEARAAAPGGVCRWRRREPRDQHRRARLCRRGQKSDLALAESRHAWVQVAVGAMRVNGQDLTAGDVRPVSDERHLNIEGIKSGEILVFDLG